MRCCLDVRLVTSFKLLCDDSQPPAALLRLALPYIPAAVSAMPKLEIRFIWLKHDDSCMVQFPAAIRHSQAYLHMRHMHELMHICPPRVRNWAAP